MFIKKILLFVAVFSFWSSAYAQETVSRQLRAFDKVITYDGISVQLSKSDKNHVEISGELTEKVVAKVSGSVLKIKMKFGNNFKGKDAHVIVYYTGDLSEIKAQGGSSITSNKVIEDKDIVLKSSEGSSIDLKVKTNKLTAKVYTGADIKLSGESENILVTVTSGGEFDGKKLKGKYGEVEISAGGSAKIRVSEILDASVTMGGSIYYYGKTETVNNSISMGGTIEKIED